MTWQSLAVVTAYERVNAVGLTSILDLGLFFWFRLASLTDAWSVHDSRVSFIHFISFCPKPLHSQQSLTVTIITLSWTVRLQSNDKSMFVSCCDRENEWHQCRPVVYRPHSADFLFRYVRVTVPKRRTGVQIYLSILWDI